MLEVQTPAKLKPFDSPARYKTTHGGRGSAKSWSIGRKLLVRSLAKRIRILCAREIQKSISASVHQLLKDQIEALGLSGAFLVTNDKITSASGSEFIFSGLSDQTAETIKSYEGIDIVWVEEAQKVSKRSWDILTPTIRKAGSEVWISMNPELDTDPTWTRFVLSPPPGSVVIEMNWRDNPWFSDELEAERQHCLISQPDDYDNIWEGKPRSSVVGAIYAKEVDAMIRGRRVRAVPYDPMLKVHTVWDLGWNDALFVGLVQVMASEVRVIHVIEDDHRTLDSIAAELNAMNLNWGRDYLPHDGHAKTLAAGGRTIAAQLKKLGRKVHPRPIPNVSVEVGIKLARMLFPRAYVDAEYGARLIECLKRYRRSVNRGTEEEGPPVHDEYSHGADMWRYLALVVDDLKNEDDDEAPSVPRYQPRDRVMGI